MARSLIALALLLAVPAAAQAPGKTWPAAKPAAVGINAAVLDSLDREIKAGQYGHVDRLVVIRKGKLVFDGSYPQDYDKDPAYADSAKKNGALNFGDLTGPYNYFNPWWHPTYRRGDLHTLQSVTKTVASVIIGVAVTRGDFPSVDTPVLAFFDTTKVANIDDRKRRMTVKHLLTMSGGIDWNENLPYTDPRNTAVGLETSHDWIAYVINRPMGRDPGVSFAYSSGESALLAHIFRRATGMDIEEYAARHLFGPLGIDRWFWKRSGAGLVDTEGGLYLEARDLARIWYLFGQRGMWNGTRIVSEDWIRQSTTPHMSVGTNPGGAKYGYKWWLQVDPTDPAKFVWAGSGFGGQFPWYFPELDLLVVVNSWNILGGPGRPGLPIRQVMGRIAKGTAK